MSLNEEPLLSKSFDGFRHLAQRPLAIHRRVKRLCHVVDDLVDPSLTGTCCPYERRAEIERVKPIGHWIEDHPLIVELAKQHVLAGEGASGYRVGIHGTCCKIARGENGGKVESSTLQEFAGDARSVQPPRLPFGLGFWPAPA